MRRVLLCLLLLLLPGCVTTMPLVPDAIPEHGSVVIGRAVTVLVGSTTRWFTPELRFFELVNVSTGDRIRVDVGSDDAWFVLPVPAGQYQLSRIQISEGAFMGLAGLDPEFQANEGDVTYVGTWRFGVESPQYDRTVLVSAVAEPERGLRDALTSYPSLDARPITTDLLNPSTVETRLYETPPYPRFKWFRRHHTS